MRRSSPKLLSLSKSSTAVTLLAFCLLVVFAASVFSPSAYAQGSKRKSLYDSIEDGDKDNPAARADWLMRGRTAPKGQSAAALRLNAHQQKMKMRAQRAAADAAQPATAMTPLVPTPWIPLGPAPLVSDSDFFGNVTGRSTAIAIDPSDTTGNTVYIAAASGGVWKSTNAANSVAANVTWTPVTDQQASLTNGAVSVKSDGTVVLVGTGEPNNAIDSYYGVGILRSTDHGAHWTLISSSDSGAHPFAGIGFTKFAWGTSNTVVAAAADAFKGDQEALLNPNTANLGMYLSSDGGSTWAWQQPTDGILADTSATDVTYNAKAGKFFASIQYHGIYSSTNGTSWARLANQPDPTNLTLTNCPTVVNFNNNLCPLSRGQLATVPGRNEMYFWYVDGNDNDFGIWQSLDGGNTWKSIDETGIANCGDSFGCGTQQAFYNLEISAVANGTGTDIYTGAVNLFKCNLASGATKCSALDAGLGQSWLNLTHVYGCSSKAMVHPDEHGMDFLVVGGKDIIYFGNDGGVYRALDGFTGLKVGSCNTSGNNQFDNLNNASLGSMTQFVSFSNDPSSQDTVLGGTQDNGSPASTTATTSSQFFTANGGDGGYNAINPNNASQWFAANTDVSIQVCNTAPTCSSTIFGNPIISNSTVGGDAGPFYTPYILDPQDTNEILVGTCRVWRGTTSGTSFTPLSVNFDTKIASSCTSRAINQVHGLAAGGPKDGSGFSNVVYAVTFGLGPLYGRGTGGEIWVTTNAATTQMSDITGSINPGNYAISSVAMDKSDATGKTAYVGVMGFGTSHVWKTTTADGNWTDWSGSGGTALPNSPVNDVLVDSVAGLIYAGTDVGLFVSSTTSASWTEVGTPSAPGAAGYLPNVPVSAIRIFNSGGVNKLRVSTYGRGIWEYSLAASPSFTLSAAPTSVSVPQGSSGTSTISVNPLNGFTGTVTFSASGLPAGVTAAFNPTSSTTSSVLTLTVGATVAPGTSTITVTGTSGSVTANTTVSLTVTAGPGFGLSANPTSVSVAQGGNGTSTITVTSVGGFSAATTLSATGLPSGVTAAFVPNPVTPPANGTVTSVVTLTATGSATLGAATVTITGTSGALTATTTIALTVTGPPTFTLSAAPSSLTITPTLAGGTSTITVNPLNGFTGTVAFTASGMPPGVTAAFNPTSSTTSSVLTLTAAANAAAGNSTITVTGKSGALMITTTIALTVTPPPNFTLSDSPTSLTITPGLTGGTTTATITPTNGFTGTVAFTASGLPAGVTAAFNPTSSTTSSVLTLTADSKLALGGNATVTITGTSGSLTQTTTLALTVAQNFTLPASLTAPTFPNPGQTTTTTMLVSPASGATFNSAVTFACSGLPTGANCAFSPAINAGGGATTVTVTVSTTGPFTGIAANRRGEPIRKVVGQKQSLWLPLSLPLAGIMLAGLAGKRLPRLYKIGGLCLVLVFAGFLVACGSSSNPAVVSVTPGSVGTLYPNILGLTNQTQQFSASVSNSTSQAVTWAVSGGIANGSIDQNGLYTAPTALPNPNSAITVTATSSASTTPGSATVTLLAPTPAGQSLVTVTATEGAVVHSTTFTLQVN